MAESDVVRIRRQIELEYEASNRTFTDFTPTAKHEFIRERQENIAHCFDDLRKILPDDEAIQVFIQAQKNVYGTGMTGESNASL